MTPIAFTDQEHERLPEHKRVVYGADQPEYLPLPTCQLVGDETRVISKWELTAEERAKVAAGEPVFIEILTFGKPLQPILPTVGLRQFCPADD